MRPVPAGAGRTRDTLYAGGVEIVLVAAVALLIGSALQRLSGTGVGLVVGPALAIAMGPGVGILTTNASSTVSGFLIMLAVLKDVNWRRYALFAPAAVLGAIPAALLVRELSAAWLQIIIGGVVVLALATTFGLPRLPEWKGRLAAFVAGGVGGFLNTTAGVAAPAMVIYSKLSRWDHREFAATLQPTFMTMGAVSVAVKLLMGSTDASALPPWWFWLVVVAAVVAGIGVGAALATRVPTSVARKVAITLAGIGGLATLAKGLLAL